jgi:hypothetical protein
MDRIRVQGLSVELFRRGSVPLGIISVSQIIGNEGTVFSGPGQHMAVYHDGLIQPVKLLVRNAQVKGCPDISRILRYRRLKKAQGLLGFIVDEQFLPLDKGTLSKKDTQTQEKTTCYARKIPHRTFPLWSLYFILYILKTLGRTGNHA